MEVFPRFPVHEKAMKTATLLRAALSIFLVEGLTLSISPRLAKSHYLAHFQNYVSCGEDHMAPTGPVMSAVSPLQ